MNTVLSKFFNLPPHLKMLLAVAGFGSIASIIFMLLPALRTKSGKIWILIILGAVLVLVGIIYLIKRMFGKKKATALEGALETQGPTRGDIAEQQQIYKEKFKSKLAELKAQGLSVYKMPWFILMGEPGCGKTATLINSGLDFPLGKDEVPGFGGTRNYNWWFTNNAVILDTAGRIAFHEEGTSDKPEWEIFVKLLKANRPRCPINGVIVAIPADKLLRDSAEEREQKATILRERLRQIHQLLGVRFPTFVIVTKMDLVGGFNEFFDEIRPDLQQRNQMFGWSRPDEFQSSYDPGTFEQTFDDVYERLRDWAMRYLQRTHATEQELGLVVTFPESFRQVRGALNDYIATIFQKSPLLEPPFFRGFYFTSSVQEGAPIFDIFAKTHGGSVVEAGTPKPVASKAFFIHDFYDKKVFPEQGLVFRSAKHVTLNKRMRRMVWMGTSALAGLMLLFFAIGVYNIRTLLTTPKADCATAANSIGPEVKAALFIDLYSNVGHAEKLQVHIGKYTGIGRYISTKMMFLGANMETPKGLISRIHTKFVLVTILEPTLREFSDRVKNGKLPAAGARDLYLTALHNYAGWYAETVGQGTWTKPMTTVTAGTRAEQFEAILACLGGGPVDRKKAVEQVKLAFLQLADGSAFAHDVLAPHAPAVMDAATMEKAVDEIHAHYKPFTDVMGGKAGERVQYWIDLFNELRTIRKSYEALLALGSGFGDSFTTAATEFLRQTADIRNIDNYEIGPQADIDTFCQTWNGLAGYLEDAKAELPQENGRILRLRDLFEGVEKRWLADFQRLEEALLVGAPREPTTEVEPIYSKIRDAKTTLKTAFNDSLKKLREQVGITGNQDPLAYYVKQKLIRVNEGEAPGGYASLKVGDKAFGVNGWMKNVLKELRDLAAGVESIEADLKELSKWPELIDRMKVQDPAQLKSVFISRWFSAVQKGSNADDFPDRRRQVIEGAAHFQKGQDFWMPADLYGLADSMLKARQDVYVGSTLRKMVAELQTASNFDRLPGLARLRVSAGFAEDAADLPFEQNEFNRGAREPAAQPDRTQVKPRGGDKGSVRIRPVQPQARSGENAERLQASKRLLTRYHTRKFLVETLREYVAVERALQDLPGDDQGVGPALTQAADNYVRAYFNDWHDVYSDFTILLDTDTLALIKSCGDESFRWKDFHKQLKENGRAIGQNLRGRLEAMIKEVVFVSVVFDSGPDDDRAWEIVDRALETLTNEKKNLPKILQGGLGRDQRLVEEYAVSFQKTWRNYVTQVTRFGPLAGGSPAPGGDGSLPDVAGLRSSIKEGANDVEDDFPFIAPLLELASHGDRLLVHHLESELAKIVTPHEGRYPLLTRDDIPDPNQNQAKLRNQILNALDPTRFLVMLRELAEFRRTYGSLYESAGSVSGNATLKTCKAWEMFLYGDEGIPPDDPPALPKRVGVNVTPDPDHRPDGTRNPGGFCDFVCVTLPVLVGRSSNPAGEICVVTRGFGGGAGGATDGWSFYWRLDATPVYAEAKAWMKAVKAGGWKEGESAWTLPPSPWALPLLVRSQESEISPGAVSIPVVFAAPGKPSIGMYIKIEFDGKFPGPIPLLAKPPQIAGMSSSSKFLTSKAGN